MPRRKPSRIEVKIEDKEELQELQNRSDTAVSTSTAGSSGSPTAASTLLHHLDRSSKDQSKPIASASPPDLIEVEVKLRLPDSKSHQSLSFLLSPFLLESHHKHSIFFDGVASELSAGRAVLRLRFYGDDPSTATRCVVSLKAKAVLIDGVSRVQKGEEEVEPSTGRRICADPAIIGSTELRVLGRVREEFGVKDVGYVCLGGFKDVRRVHEWKGLELDQTMFDFGTLYEIECESGEPEKAKWLIEEL